MKRLTRFYWLLFFGYILFLLCLIMALPGCGRENSALPEPTVITEAPPGPAVTETSTAPLGTWEEPEGPYVAVHVYADGGRLYYIPLPEELAAAIDGKLAAGTRLAGLEPEPLEGWGKQLPQGTDELAVFYPTASGSPALLRNAAGEYAIGGVAVTQEAGELLNLVAAATGWDVYADPADYSGLTKVEMLLGDEVLVTVTDTERLRAFEELLQNQTRCVSASQTPGEVIELRCTCGDGTVRSLAADPENPRLWLPPYCYYRYNGYESTGTLPLLEALGLETWPEAVTEALQNGFQNVPIRATLERLAPTPGEK